MPFENDSIPSTVGKHVLLLPASDSIRNSSGKVIFSDGFTFDNAFTLTPSVVHSDNTYSVSPEQIYGHKSTLPLAHSSKDTVGIGIPRKYPLDTPWSFVLSFAFPLIALLLIRYSQSYLKRIPRLLVSIKAARKEYSDGLQNHNRTVTLLAWFSLIPAAILGVYLLQKYPSSLGDSIGIGALPIVAGVLLAYIIVKNTILSAASILTFSKSFTQELRYNSNLFFGSWGFSSFFFILMLFIYDGKQLDTLLYIVGALCIIFTVLYLVRSLQLFLLEKISLFFWILYLCALEISPALLVINYLYPTK